MGFSLIKINTCAIMYRYCWLCKAISICMVAICMHSPLHGSVLPFYPTSQAIESVVVRIFYNVCSDDPEKSDSLMKVSRPQFVTRYVVARERERERERDIERKKNSICHNVPGFDRVCC